MVQDVSCRVSTQNFQILNSSDVKSITTRDSSPNLLPRRVPSAECRRLGPEHGPARSRDSCRGRWPVGAAARAEAAAGNKRSGAAEEVCRTV